MTTETSAVNFRQNLGEMLNQVQYRHDSVIINKDGKPVAALFQPSSLPRTVIVAMQGKYNVTTSPNTKSWRGVMNSRRLLADGPYCITAKAISS